MRTALLIGLAIMLTSAAAQAQNSPYRNPYGMGPAKDPYDLPKSLQGNPYNRDYSKPDPLAAGPGYRKLDGSAYRRPSPSSSYGGFGAGTSGPANYGFPSPPNRQQNPNCSRPGVVC